MVSSVGKRNYSQLRSSSAEPELVTTKRILVDKSSSAEYQFKTLCTPFLTIEMVRGGYSNVSLGSNIKYEFKNKLRRPLLIPISENHFLQELEQLPEFKGRKL